MHYIQYDILDLLIHNRTLRFSELKPKLLESNLFQYHLKHTIKQGYVTKTDGGYTLTPKGLYYADRHSGSLRGLRELPKTITVAVARDHRGRILLRPKLKQPFIGDYHLPAGKLHMGESIRQAVEREWLEKVAATPAELTLRSTAHARVRVGGELVSEYIAFVYEGQLEGAAPDDAVWYDPAYPDQYRLVPTVAEVIATLDAPSVLLHEIYVETDND